jgi:hypothetical protein
MRCHRGFQAVVLVWFVATAAHPARGDGNDIDRGIARYDDLEYVDAISIFEAALKSKTLTKAQRVEGLRYLALSYIVVGRIVDAKDAFRKLLEVEPDYRLPTTADPRALDILRDLRGSVPRPPAMEMMVSVEPTPLHQGAAVHVNIVIAGGKAEDIDTVVVKHRSRGDTGYSAVSLSSKSASEQGKRFSATIPGAFVNGDALEYFVTALAPGGSVLASEGSSGAPLATPITSAAKQQSGTPIYKKWWFWTAASAVAGTTAGYLYLRSRDERAVIDVNVQ